MKVKDIIMEADEYSWNREITNSANERNSKPQLYCLKDSKHKTIKSHLSSDQARKLYNLPELTKKYGKLYIAKDIGWN